MYGITFQTFLHQLVYAHAGSCASDSICYSRERCLGRCIYCSNVVNGSHSMNKFCCNPKMQWCRFVVIATINFLSLSVYVLVEAHVP